jgi:hypothetical protein
LSSLSEFGFARLRDFLDLINDNFR